MLVLFVAETPAGADRNCICYSPTLRLTTGEDAGW